MVGSIGHGFFLDDIGVVLCDCVLFPCAKQVSTISQLGKVVFTTVPDHNACVHEVLPSGINAFHVIIICCAPPIRCILWMCVNKSEKAAPSSKTLRKRILSTLNAQVEANYLGYFGKLVGSFWVVWG